MLVFVINQNKKPLMPCKPSKARKLLQAGKAKVVRNTPFTIQLLFGSSGYTQPVTAGMDTGSKVVGCAAIANGKSVVSVRNLPERKRFEKDGQTEDVPENQKR
ncbi:hypothetical protein MSLAZ_2280 [Methanosarcina lacustris Z-7289]|uniref:RRXRR domain-containing protein n=1 Tax=Methanosarcina lacustris Z-7289 TaxID=1434111 RepID=A0A0E3S5A3_9EURY|nr:RRXRR domain-containing protein [Methanosarcina lacustris]AKB75541.1 hypothetical protein MSLAZ_2280 [Methanosarcina lacustris Z-7289]